MPETHMARAVAKKGRLLTIDLFICIPEISEWYTARSYLLQVLWDRSPKKGKAAALHNAISEKDRSSGKWLAKNKDTFVESVNLVSDANFPAKSESVFAKLDPRKLPRATFEIEVTDSKWIEHITTGDKWDSVPLDVEGW